MKTALARQCAAYLVNPKRIFLDIDVRWDSTYVTLQWCIEIESFIQSLLTVKDTSDYETSYLSLSSDKCKYLKVLFEWLPHYYLLL